MSRVILNGKNRKYIAICDQCESVIQYKKKEVKHEHIPREQTMLKLSSTEYDYIHCPVCQSIIEHDPDSALEVTGIE